MLVFVINKESKPLMPCKPSRARKLLLEGKAKVIKKTPFIIKLLFGSSGYVQPVIAGREQILELPKTHYFDAVSICSDKKVKLENGFYLKKHVSKGDYQQRTGKRSEKKIPTGKLFGLRKFDLIKTEQGVGIVKGKRSSGYFAITDVMGNKIHDSAKVKQNCERLRARTTTLIEQKIVPVKLTHSSPTCRASPFEEGVSCLWG